MNPIGQFRHNNGLLRRISASPIFKRIDPYLQDQSRARVALALQTEIAECLNPTFKEFKFPWYIRHSIRTVLWISNLAYIGLRALSRAASHNHWLAALHGLVQESVSGMSLPVLTAWTMNWLQDKFYNRIKLHHLIKNLIRPAVSLKACSMMVKTSDPIGRKLATKVCDWLTPKPDDT